MAELEALRLQSEAQTQEAVEGDPYCLCEYAHELIVALEATSAAKTARI